MFIDIDDSFSGKVQNAYKTESEICGRGTVAFLVKFNQFNRKFILENALFIPESSHSLVSISKLREAGAEVLIGPELSIIDKSGVEYQLGRRKTTFGTLVRLIKLARKTAYCPVAYKCGTKDCVITILRTLAN